MLNEQAEKLGMGIASLRTFGLLDRPSLVKYRHNVEPRIFESL